MQQEGIPYNEFLQKMKNGEIEEAVVTDKIISGKFTGNPIPTLPLRKSNILSLSLCLTTNSLKNWKNMG
jgi:FtsH-like protein